MTGKHANQCVGAHDVVVQKHRRRVQSDQNIAQCRPDLGSRLVEVVPRGFQVHIRHAPMHARRGREGQAAAALNSQGFEPGGSAHTFRASSTRSSNPRTACSGDAPVPDRRSSGCSGAS